MNRRTSMRLAAATLLAAATGCASTGSAPATIADAVAADPNLSTLNALVVKAGLADTLKASGPFTVFAPSNDAFKRVPEKTLAELQQDPAKLRAVLTYHVLPLKATAADVKQGAVKTVQGADLQLARAGGFVTVEDAMVTKADVMAGNGVVHVVDRVLMPPAK